MPVTPTASQRERLKKMAYGQKTPHHLRQRATIVLAAARGHSNARIAADTRVHVDTVRTWRGRFAAGALPALEDLKRSGRPPSFTPVQVAEGPRPGKWCKGDLHDGVMLPRMAGVVPECEAATG